MTTLTRPSVAVGSARARPDPSGVPDPEGVPNPAPARPRRSRPRRLLHPVAWWLWALGLAAAASRTTNPVLLALVVAVAGLVVSARRTRAPWARAYRTFLLLGLGVIVIRTVFAALLSPVAGGPVLLDLPAAHLPAIFAGIRLGGPVTLDGLAAGAVGGLQLAALLACVGAANALAHPLRLLKVVPGALYEVGVAVVVAVTAAPQLLVAAGRIRTARRLRGRDARGLRAIAETAVPVLHTALERSLRLAASMDARGYGRRAPVDRRLRALTTVASLGGLLAVLAGLFALLDGSAAAGPGNSGSTGSAPSAGSGLSGVSAGATLFAVGIVVTVLALVLGSRRTVRTRYRPDPWRAAEWLVTAAGAAAAAALVVTAHTAAAGALSPSTVPLAAPGLPLLATVGIVLAALPAVLAPPPPELTPAAPTTASRTRGRGGR